MIPAAALQPLLIAMLCAWIGGMALLHVLLLSPQLAPRLAGARRMLLQEAFILALPVVLVLLPHPWIWLAFAAFAARIICEALIVLRAAPKQRRLPALVGFLIMPILPLILLGVELDNKAHATTLLLSLLLVEFFDSFALLGGRLFGRTPLAPALSPNKTWEGFATGFLALAVAALLLTLAGITTPAQAAWATICTAAFATLGDLAASWPKRNAGRKDYPVLLQGQGGMLDIYDAWIVAAPLTAIVLQRVLT
ncbi:phosphatidate cytidylyltransferase [Aestuariivirga litoralis]|uniref:phosphatidate cytidylyltransferase n=1 Tax=Aestuariivirga litoralis TaxID=2650924 RepID=UPI0018C7CA89|nr:phosphatidate cytidylyltransferase [Aestuariivirga litoralis]MBG1230779.1 hypothetical protein [Aestuariivirga litoralis]